MRKLLKFGVLCGVLTLLLCVSAFATDVTETGLYGLASPDGNNVTLTAGTGSGASFTPVDAATYKVSESGESLVQDENGAEFYPDAESVKVEIKTSNTDQYLVIALSDEEAPNKDNIIYIDQTTGAADGTIVFYVYPKAWEKGEYYVWCSSTNGALTKIATVKSFIPYKLGDVDDIEGISANDALYILQTVAQKRTLVGAKALAADVDGIAGISANDALYVLQAVAQKRVLGA